MERWIQIEHMEGTPSLLSRVGGITLAQRHARTAKRVGAAGIRFVVENDVLIGKDGNTDLMANIPIEPDDIEALMRA